MRLELQAIYHSNSPDPEQTVKEIEESVTYDIVVMEIGAISAFRVTPDIEYSVIHTHGANFIIPMTLKQLDRLILENK